MPDEKPPEEKPAPSSAPVVSEDAENTRTLGKLLKLHEGLGRKIDSLIAAGTPVPKPKESNEPAPPIPSPAAKDNDIIRLLRDIGILAPVDSNPAK